MSLLVKHSEETLDCRLLSMGLQSRDNNGGGQCYFLVWASFMRKNLGYFLNTPFSKTDIIDHPVPLLAQKLREWTVGEMRQSVEYKEKFNEIYPNAEYEEYLCDMGEPHSHVDEIVIRFLSDTMGFHQKIIYCDGVTHIEPRNGDVCCNANTIQLASIRERCYHVNGVTQHQSGHYMGVEDVFEAESEKTMADASSWTFVGQQPVNDTDRLLAIALSDVERRISEAGLKLNTLMRKLSADLSASMQATAAAPQVAGSHESAFDFFLTNPTSQSRLCLIALDQP